MDKKVASLVYSLLEELFIKHPKGYSKLVPYRKFELQDFLQPTLFWPDVYKGCGRFIDIFVLWWGLGVKFLDSIMQHDWTKIFKSKD